MYVFRMDHGGRFSHSLTLSGQQGAVVTALGSHLQSRGGRIESGDGSVLLAGDDSGRVVIYR